MYNSICCFLYYIYISIGILVCPDIYLILYSSVYKYIDWKLNSRIYLFHVYLLWIPSFVQYKELVAPINSTLWHNFKFKCRCTKPLYSGNLPFFPPHELQYLNGQLHMATLYYLACVQILDWIWKGSICFCYSIAFKPFHLHHSKLFFFKDQIVVVWISANRIKNYYVC